MKTRQQRRWQALTVGQRQGIVVGGILELGVTILALLDLRRRPAAQMKGKKAVWMVLTFVQPVGPLVYLLFGRRVHPAGT